MGLPRDCSPGAILAFPHITGHRISTSQMILTDSGSSPSSTPNSCYVANCAAQPGGYRAENGNFYLFIWFLSPCCLPSLNSSQAGSEMGQREQEANGGQLHWQSLGAPLTVRVAKWGEVGEAASLDPKAGRGPGSQVTSSLLTLPHPSQKEPTVQGQR